MPSGPGVFPFFNVIYSGLLISAFKGGFVVTFNSIYVICRGGLKVKTFIVAEARLMYE